MRSERKFSSKCSHILKYNRINWNWSESQPVRGVGDHPVQLPPPRTRTDFSRPPHVVSGFEEGIHTADLRKRLEKVLQMTCFCWWVPIRPSGYEPGCSLPLFLTVYFFYELEPGEKSIQRTQVSELRTNWELVRGPLGVQLTRKGEKGWKQGQRVDIVLNFPGLCG
ncbi:uncharacterized protein LOC120892938 [Ictidomys tridecemlineatus]